VNCELSAELLTVYRLRAKPEHPEMARASDCDLWTV